MRQLIFSLSLTVEAENGGTNVLGKLVSDLQTGVSVAANAITGTLKYVTGYTGFSSDPSLQDGNFLALKFATSKPATVTVEIVGGTSGPVALDADMNWVGRIANKDTQTIRVIATAGGNTITKNYSLTGLVCNPS